MNQLVVAGATDALERHGVPKDHIDLVRVPAFRSRSPSWPSGSASRASTRAVICLGCVIRGETSHYDHVAGTAASGIATAGLSSGVPVIFGVLTCETLEQAINRAGGKAGNKGARRRH